MKKLKPIFIILVIVILLAAAGVFLWKSANTSKAEPTPAATPAATPATATPADGVGVLSSAPSGNPQTILPHGNSLDFSKVEKFNPSKQIFQYPTVTPDQVGSGLNDMISQ